MPDQARPLLARETAARLLQDVKGYSRSSPVLDRRLTAAYSPSTPENLRATWGGDDAPPSGPRGSDGARVSGDLDRDHAFPLLACEGMSRLSEIPRLDLDTLDMEVADVDVARLAPERAAPIRAAVLHLIASAMWKRKGFVPIPDCI